MSYNQQFRKDFFKTIVSNSDLIYNMLKYELPIPLDALDENNNTVLNIFIFENNNKCANLLLDNIKKNIYNDNIAKFLLNKSNNDGNSPIHLAVINNQQEIAKKLYKLGADLSKPNNEDFIVEFSDSESKQIPTNIYNRNDMHNIINQLSVPINKKIPDELETITSTEVIETKEIETKETIETIETKERIETKEIIESRELQDQIKLNEFDFIKNFLDEQNNQINLSESSNMNSINTNDFLKYMREKRPQNGGNISESSINTTDFIKYISQQNVQTGGNTQTMTGVRQIQNNLKKIEQNDTQTVTDSLNIIKLIEDQRGGGNTDKKDKKHP